MTSKNSVSPDERAKSSEMGLFARHRKLFLWLMVGWAFIIGVLIWLSSGPQNEPFVYQVF